jgi:hypothetical protein
VAFDWKIQFFTPVQIPFFTTGAPASGGDNYVGIYGGQFQSGTPYDPYGYEQIQAFTLDQLKLLTTGKNDPDCKPSAPCHAQIQAFDSWQIPYFTNEQIAIMRTLQVASFVPGKQIPYFDWDQIQTWDKDQLQVLTPAQIQSFRTIQIAGFALSQVEWFTLTQLKALSPYQIRALTPAQVSKMTKVGTYWDIFQVHAFDAELMEQLYGSLTAMELWAMTDKQIDALSDKTQNYIRGQLPLVEKWYLHDGQLDLEEMTWDASGELLDMVRTVHGTLGVAGTLSPEADTWSASVNMYDETGKVLGTWDIGGKMKLTETDEGTYIELYNEDGTEKVAIWYNIPVDEVLDIDWDKLIETYKIPIENWTIENWIQMLHIESDAGVAVA